MKLRQALVNAGLIIGSVVLSLALAEAVLRSLFPVETGVVWRMNAPHGQAYAVNIPNSRTVHRFGSYHGTYAINSLGLRAGEYDPAIPAVLFLGDSFTFGLFVEREATAVDRMQQMAAAVFGANAVQLLNGAVGAWGLADYLAYLEDYAIRFRPKLVVLNVNYVDISRGYRNPLFQFDRQAGQLRRRQPVDSSAPWPAERPIRGRIRDFLYTHSQLATFLRRAYERVQTLRRPDAADYFSSDFDRDEVQAFTRAALLALRDRAARIGAKLAIIDLGYYYQSIDARKNQSIDYAGLEILPELSSEMKIPFLSLQSAVEEARAAGQTLEIPGDGHPSAEGYAVIAQASWPFLEPLVREAIGKR